MPYGVEVYEPPSSALLAQTTFSETACVKFDPSLFHDLAPVQEHLDSLYILADLVRAAHQIVDQHECRLQHQLKELWEDNPTIRKRGLRGGTARKQRKKIGNYVSFADHAAISRAFLEHRLEVEKTDYLGRNRIAGLRAMREMLEDSFDYVREQQHQCEEVLLIAESFVNGTITPMDFVKLASIDEEFPEEDVGKLEDIKDMLEVFHEEYDTSL